MSDNRSPTTSVWPDRLKIRDTGLHDDMGGPGQRIYTTAGRGYETREYVRADADTPAGSSMPIRGSVLQCFHEGCQWRELMQTNNDLRDRLERTSKRAGELQAELSKVIDALKEFRRYG